MRSILVALAVAVALTSAPAGALGDGLTATCNGSSITVDYTGYNFGDLPVVSIWRRNLTDCGSWTLVTSVAADLLAWTQIDAVDTDVVPGKLYRYSVGTLAQADPLGVDPVDYQGTQWQVTAYTGCGNAPVADGAVRQEWDGATLLTIADPCPGSCYPTAVVWSGTDVVADYLGGEPVTIYGSYAWTLHVGWAIFATSAEPGDCTTIGVEARPWAGVKQLYR